ncbi:nicotinamide-nucleotide amidohydrolase family protein [Pseudoalteromonas tunicata]|uniref:nicotinamide-nucleotide amidohydrolase family protein n=1 Tax=Pseudoalteromonas tunicata TaxID=314281 RepID=UPI00273D82F3|nr:nicotinamide-nucleotide amidohydrolase family protein [Pseudoalteromonas tunicata]MDP5213979.1 nicotinamide-nucleotide amidohydrolase family protein [Pseudoalteromonas tunicata]
MELQQEISQLAAELGAILADKGIWITTAESCTGGGISYALTDTARSSRYIDRCFVTYSNEAKQALLGVSATTLANFGAVSEQTVIEMAQGAALAANAQLAISVSGIAGPGGGSTDKPVGTVWFAITLDDKTQSLKRIFNGSRSEVRVQAIVFALKKLIEIIKN